jgi:hypothetical protein
VASCATARVAPTRIISIVLALAQEVERVIRSHRELLGLAFPMRAPQITELVVRPDSAIAGRGLALIDPSSRRRNWVIKTSLDGRRSALPYADYADAIRPAA